MNTAAGTTNDNTAITAFERHRRGDCTIDQRW